MIRKEGHEIIFCPKFHCALHYIEYYWAALKRYTRENCKYSFAELEGVVDAAMESVSLQTIWGFAERSKVWMAAYIEGLTEEQRAYAEKQYKSHQRQFQQVLVYSAQHLAKVASWHTLAKYKFELRANDDFANGFTPSAMQLNKI